MVLLVLIVLLAVFAAMVVFFSVVVGPCFCDGMHLCLRFLSVVVCSAVC